MKIQRNLLTALGVVALLSVTAAYAGPGSGGTTHPAGKSADSTTAEVGKPAPNFTLPDTDGKEHSLADFKGKFVILQWINPDCPFCRRVTQDGTVSEMLKKLKAIDEDVVHLAVNSTHYMDAEQTSEYLKKHKLESPGLVDTDGTVARMYGAKTTPHVFVIDKKGVLRYSGAIDDDRTGRKSDRMNYIVNTVQQITAGKEVAPSTTQPYGCSVKYAATGQGRGKGRGGVGRGRGSGRGGRDQ